LKPSHEECYITRHASRVDPRGSLVALSRQAEQLLGWTGPELLGEPLNRLIPARFHLKALPVDYVKIGGHYVRSVADDPVYGTLVTAVNQIGRIMGITTIAEEVDSEAALDQLRAIGIEYAQGHAVAPPVPLMDADGNVALPCIQLSA
jgi:hypothetical protein